MKITNSVSTFISYGEGGWEHSNIVPIVAALIAIGLVGLVVYYETRPNGEKPEGVAFNRCKQWYEKHNGRNSIAANKLETYVKRNFGLKNGKTVDT